MKIVNSGKSKKSQRHLIKKCLIELNWQRSRDVFIGDENKRTIYKQQKKSSFCRSYYENEITEHDLIYSSALKDRTKKNEAVKDRLMLCLI